MPKDISIGAQVSGATCTGEPFSGTVTERRGPFTVVLDDHYVTPVSLITSAEAPGPEEELRKLWTAQGVPADRQNELIAEIQAKAAPGAMVGPFQIPHDVAGALQRRADSRLMAKKPQEACDIGLFSDDANQLDLVDMARRK